MALTQITTDGIKDGTITGTDLATSFATTGDFTFTGANYNVLWDKSDNALEFAANAKAVFAGDLTISHTGDHGNIVNTDGNLNIKSQGTISLFPANDNDGITIVNGGAVSLFHSNVKKFETTSAGVIVPVDSGKVSVGSTGNLFMYHTGTSGSAHGLLDNSFGTMYHLSPNFEFRQKSTNHTLMKLNGGADVQLYYDNVNRLATSTTGIRVDSRIAGMSDNDTYVNIGSSGNNQFQFYTGGVSRLFLTGGPSDGGTVEIRGDNNFLQIGAGQDLDLHHNGTNSYIRNKTGDLHIRPLVAEEGIILKPNGAVELYHDNSKKFETIAGGVKATGYLTCDGIYLNSDNEKAFFGASQDLQIYHDGTDSFVKNGTGVLRILGDSVQIRNNANNETGLAFAANGAVELYHDNIKRFETTSSGISVAGNGVFTGNVQINDGNFLNVGNSGDLQIYHDGANSYLKNAGTGNIIFLSDDVQFKSDGGGNTGLTINTDAAVELYHNNSKKLETTSTGISVIGTISTAGTGGNITTPFTFKDESSNFIANFTGAQAELYYNGSKKLETTTNGIQMRGDIRFNNSTWTGETNNGKIQTHGSNMYLQNAGGSWQFRKTNGTAAANIASNGTYTASDLTFKKDVATISNSVDTIKKLTGRSFTWKEDNTKSFGVIAQEVETVLPELVTNTEEPEGSEVEPSKMVNYPAFAGHFIEAIKELATKVEALETEVAALKAG